MAQRSKVNIRGGQQPIQRKSYLRKGRLASWRLVILEMNGDGGDAQAFDKVEIMPSSTIQSEEITSHHSPLSDQKTLSLIGRTYATLAE